MLNQVNLLLSSLKSPLSGDTSPVSMGNPSMMVKMFNELVNGESFAAQIQEDAVPAVKKLDFDGDYHMKVIMEKLDQWRNSGNSYLLNIQNNLQEGPLNTFSMMKIQMDLLKFSLGYETTSKIIGKGISAIDTLLRSQ